MIEIIRSSCHNTPLAKKDNGTDTNLCGWCFEECDQMTGKKIESKKEEFIKATCINGHVWGDGKNIFFDRPCPECGNGISGIIERRTMKVSTEQAKGWIISFGGAKND